MTTYAFLFPGQGSQYVGMTQKLSNRPAIDAVFRKAESVLGYDLHSLCLSGPQSRLDETVICQPAVVATSLATAESLKQDKPEVGGATLAGRFAHFQISRVDLLARATNFCRYGSVAGPLRGSVWGKSLHSLLQRHSAWKQVYTFELRVVF